MVTICKIIFMVHWKSVKESCSAIANFKCRSDGACFSRQKFCDGNVDCADGSDEEDCVCATDEFTCADQLSCIPRASQLCNGVRDCSFGILHFKKTIHRRNSQSI